MKTMILLLSVSVLFVWAARADENFDALKREIEALTRRVTALEEDNNKLKSKSMLSGLLSGKS